MACLFPIERRSEPTKDNPIALWYVKYTNTAGKPRCTMSMGSMERAEAKAEELAEKGCRDLRLVLDHCCGWAF